MKFKIERISSHKIVCFRNVGPYGSGNFETMATLKKWAKENELLKDSIIFARIHDNPNITLPENCRYDACLVIDESIKINNSSINEGVIDSGKYAVIEIDHTEAAVEDTWRYIFKAVANKTLEYDQSKPILERYKFALVKKNKCEICVPIK